MLIFYLPLAPFFSNVSAVELHAMRKFLWWQHLLTAVLVTVAIFAVFSQFRKDMPNPEEFSPQVYFIASLMLLAGCIRMGAQPLRWLYWLVFALCVFIFLDEIAYGVELLGFQPIYIARYNFYMRDLHSSISFVRGVLEEWLPQAGWNPALFITFLRIDLVLLLGGLAQWYLARQGLHGASEANWRARIMTLLAVASAATSLLAVGFLLWLPADPKNALLLGLSPARLAAVAAALLYPGLLLWLSFKRPDIWQRLFVRLEATLARHPTAITAGLALAVLAGFIFQVQASFTFLPDELVRLTRIAATVVWLMAQALWLWLAVQLWRGRLRTPVITLVRQGWQTIKNHPTLIYVGVALVIVFIAQLIDQNYLPLDELLYTPNYHIHYWATWTEESFEMIGAFLFALGALVMPARSARR